MKSSDHAPVHIPVYIKEDTWEAFEEMRSRKRCPLTDFAARRVIGKLEEFWRQGYDADWLLAEAIEHSWTSVFLCRDAVRRQVTSEEAAAADRVRQMASGAFRIHAAAAGGK